MFQHEIRRVRREPVRRRLRVAAKTFITPRMLRIVFESDELAGFESPSPDDHVKIFVPADGAGEPAMRDFTPRTWDPEAGRLALDFALHENGPASNWALRSRTGDVLEIGGPHGSTIVPDDFDWYVLVGDATALPSIGRRVEGLRAGVPARVVALVADREEQQSWTTAARCEVHWLTATGKPEEDAAAVCSTLRTLGLPEGDGFVWIAAEASVAHAAYRETVEVLRHPKEWVKAAGYWSAGQKEAGRIE